MVKTRLVRKPAAQRRGGPLEASNPMQFSPRGVAADSSQQQSERDGSSRSQVRGPVRINLERLIGDNTPGGTRVPCPPSGQGGAAASAAAKQRAHDPVKKRAFRRARRRAEANGFTYYRNRLMTLKQLHGLACRTPVQKPKCPTADLNSRFNVVTWNCSGLSMELFEEIKQWMAINKQVHALFLQETHWGTAMLQEWSQNGLHFVQSAHPKCKQGGVMIILQEACFPKQCVRWQEILPGRILHVRCHVAVPTDLICVYQKTQSFLASQQDEAFKQRSTVWRALKQLLVSIPIRNLLFVCGDLNCSLLPDCRHVGQGVPEVTLTPKQLKDRAEAMDCLYSADLLAANTWGKKKQAWTFSHPGGTSVLDYILVRRRHADTTTRASQPDRQDPLASWRSYGHVRVMASVPKIWKPWTLGHTRALPKIPSSPSPELAHSVLVNPPKTFEEQDKRVPTLAGGQSVIARIRTTSSSISLTALWGLRSKMRSFTPLFALFQKSLKHGLRCVMSKWALAAKHCAEHRKLRKQCKAQKRARLLVLLEQAEQAALHGRQKDLHAVVRRLSHKYQKSNIRLRDSHDRLMSPEQELHALASYAGSLFDGIPASEIPFDLVKWLSPADWEAAYRALKPDKSVLAGAASQAQYKQNAGSALAVPSCHLEAQSILEHCLPPRWTTIQLVWLAKPGKTPTKPQNLRSVGLMTPDTKAFLNILSNAIRPYIMARLVSTPRYAYRKEASTLGGT